MASCLQWPSVQAGHWSAAALFYASMLVALLAIVTGSQQSLILPNDAKLNTTEDPSDERKPAAPQRTISHLSRQESKLEQNERDYLNTVIYRLSKTHDKGWPNKLHVFALQAPMMFLSWCVVFFLAGLCSVIFGPLARQLAWNDDAKVRSFIFVPDTANRCDRLRPHSV